LRNAITGAQALADASWTVTRAVNTLGPASDSLSQPIARSASPSHVVRTVARTMVTS